MALRARKPIKVRRLRRRINVGAASTLEQKVRQAESTHVRYVLKHPQCKLIIDAIKEGIRSSEIARYFAVSGLLDINERTFAEYVNTFKRERPDIIASGDDRLIDSIINANAPDVDAVTELTRLYRLQKLRLKIDVNTEQNIGKLFGTTVKEIEATHKILESLAKAQGHIKSGAESATGDAETDPEGRDALRRLRSDENARERMTSLTSRLVGALQNGIKEKTSA